MSPWPLLLPDNVNCVIMSVLSAHRDFPFPLGHLQGKVSCHRSQSYHVVAERPTNRGDLLVVESDGFAGSSFTGPSMLQKVKYGHDLTVQCLTYYDRAFLAYIGTSG